MLIALPHAEDKSFVFRRKLMCKKYEHFHVF